MTDKTGICKICEKEFPKKNWNQECCSPKCKRIDRDNYYKAKVEITCQNCGETYLVTRNHYFSGRSKGARNLCSNCRRNNNHDLESPETELELHDPKENKFKELGLSPEAQDFPGLLWPESF